VPKINPYVILLSATLSLVWGQTRGQSTPDAVADWPMYAHDYTSTRYSPQTEITPKNVTNLKQICSYPLPEASTFESSLVEIGGTLYFTTSDTTYAIDASNCRLKWREKHGSPEPDRTVRGVAVEANRLFRGFRDGYVIAYDTSNGEQLWSTKLTAPDGRTATIAAAPLAWNGMLFIGTSGAEQNCACFVTGIDAATGRVVWTFNVTPAKGQPGADSWPQGITPGGGSTWTSFTIDPESASLYFSTGNPGYDFAANYRTGANLYTNSVVVLDAKSGALRNYYQIVPHDYHDWDLTAAPVLLTTKSGQRRVMAAGKDGFLTAIDPKGQKILWKAPATTIENIEAPLTTEGTHVCPGATGGVQWNGPAFSPATNLVYVNAVDWCSTIKSDPDFDGKKNFLGSANAFGDHDPDKTGWVTAIDADSGAVRWKFKATTPMVAGIAVTAGGLVLTADLASDFLAFDAESGKLLQRIKLGQPTGGGVITYRAGGKQRIAVATGLEDRILQVHGQPAVVVLGL
jgi:alcohol dehydrogenase (cytochrome c)